MIATRNNYEKYDMRMEDEEVPLQKERWTCSWWARRSPPMGVPRGFRVSFIFSTKGGWNPQPAHYCDAHNHLYEFDTRQQGQSREYITYKTKTKPLQDMNVTPTTWSTFSAATSSRRDKALYGHHHVWSEITWTRIYVLVAQINQWTLAHNHWDKALCMLVTIEPGQ